MAPLAVALGGAVGSLARYAVGMWVLSWSESGAWGTFIVNVSGAFMLGLLMGATTARIEMHSALRDGLAVGVLGGYTTFSTLMYQSLRQLETGSPTAAVLNLTGSVAIGIAATFAGLALGRTA